jgi:SAM-dependent methyltransferase
VTDTGREQRLVFGEVADEYDDVRPGYPTRLADAVFDYAGAVPDAMVELGAGTGKATVAFAGRVPSLTCVEPDPAMAAVLAARLGSAVTVRLCRFEDWVPPPGGVPLLACAQAWHWMDPERRLSLAHKALAPGGVLALFGHTYLFTDHATRTEVTEVYARYAPELIVDVDVDDVDRQVPEPHASALFTDGRTVGFETVLPYPTVRYLALLDTFSAHRMLAGDRRAALHRGIGEVIDARGGVLDVRLLTELVLARRAG